MEIGGYFKIRENRRSWPKSKFRSIFAFKIKFYRLFDICLQFFKSLAIGNHRHVNTGCGVDPIFLRHPKLDDVFHKRIIAQIPILVRTA